MKKKNWSYQIEKEVRNFRDLEREKDRLALHQKFLGELLHQDKLLFKQSLSIGNLLTEIVSAVLTQTTEDKQENTENPGGPLSLVYAFSQWLIKQDKNVE